MQTNVITPVSPGATLGAIRSSKRSMRNLRKSDSVAITSLLLLAVGPGCITNKKWNPAATQPVTIKGSGFALTGDWQGKLMYEQQPLKMSSAEALCETEAPASFSIFSGPSTLIEARIARTRS